MWLMCICKFSSCSFVQNMWHVVEIFQNPAPFHGINIWLFPRFSRSLSINGKHIERRTWFVLNPSSQMPGPSDRWANSFVRCWGRFRWRREGCGESSPRGDHNGKGDWDDMLCSKIDGFEIKFNVIFWDPGNMLQTWNVQLLHKRTECSPTDYVSHDHEVLMSHVLRLLRGWPSLFRTTWVISILWQSLFLVCLVHFLEARPMPSFGRMYNYLWITFCNDASLVVPFVWWESSFGRSLSLRFRLTVWNRGGWDGWE